MKKIKNASVLIGEMVELHTFKPLKNIMFCKDFLNLFDKKYQILVEKIFIKNKILFIIAKNHIGFQELNHENTKKNIKFLAKIYAKEYKNSPFDELDGIKVLSKDYKNSFLKAQNNETSNTYQSIENTYLELSNASFENHFSDELLKAKFEELRKIIKNNIKKEF